MTYLYMIVAAIPGLLFLGPAGAVIGALLGAILGLFLLYAIISTAVRDGIDKSVVGQHIREKHLDENHRK